MKTIILSDLIKDHGRLTHYQKSADLLENQEAGVDSQKLLNKLNSIIADNQLEKENNFSLPIAIDDELYDELISMRTNRELHAILDNNPVYKVYSFVVEIICSEQSMLSALKENNNNFKLMIDFFSRYMITYNRGITEALKRERMDDINLFETALQNLNMPYPFSATDLIDSSQRVDTLLTSFIEKLTYPEYSRYIEQLSTLLMLKSRIPYYADLFLKMDILKEDENNRDGYNSICAFIKNTNTGFNSLTIMPVQRIMRIVLLLQGLLQMISLLPDHNEKDVEQLSIQLEKILEVSFAGDRDMREKHLKCLHELRAQIENVILNTDWKISMLPSFHIKAPQHPITSFMFKMLNCLDEKNFSRICNRIILEKDVNPALDKLSTESIEEMALTEILVEVKKIALAAGDSKHVFLGKIVGRNKVEVLKFYDILGKLSAQDIGLFTVRDKLLSEFPAEENNVWESTFNKI